MGTSSHEGYYNLVIHSNQNIQSTSYSIHSKRWDKELPNVRSRYNGSPSTPNTSCIRLERDSVYNVLLYWKRGDRFANEKKRPHQYPRLEWLPIIHQYYATCGKHSDCRWRAEAVSRAVGPTVSGSSSTDSTRRNYTANVANIKRKLQCLTDISILTMICTRFSCVLTRNRSNGNSFPYNRPFPLLTFTATASPCLQVWP